MRPTRIILSLLLGMLLPAISYAAAPDLPQSLVDEITSQVSIKSGTGEVTLDSAAYTVTFRDHRPVAIRKNVLPEQWKESLDKDIANFIEEGAASHSLSLKEERFNGVKFSKGSWKSLDNILPEGEFSVAVDASRIFSLAMDTESGRCEFSFPLEYDKINGGSRGEVENAFIQALQEFVPVIREIPELSPEELEQLGENLYVRKGGVYMLPEVNQNLFAATDDSGEYTLIYDPQFPAATIANMINAGGGYKADIDLTFSKHEYGETETITIPLEALIQYCREKGCQVFWGLDSIDDSELKGTIFCFNATQGYDHVIRIEGDPSRIGREDFSLKGRGSLYIPTNNVHNLFQKFNPDANAKPRFK